MIKVPAHALQPGDIVGSGETVHSVIVNSVRWPSSKVCVRLVSRNDPAKIGRECMWGKHTLIGVKRTVLVTGEK